MKIMKKSLSVVLAALMLISVFAIVPLTAQAAGWVTSADGKYKYKLLGDGTIEITKSYVTGYSVTVPSEIDGYKVTSIGEIAYSRCTEISKLNISEGIVNIGDGAFQEGDCDSSLVEVNLPSTLKTIGKYAFLSHTLKKVKIPSSVTEIGDFAFAFDANQGSEPSGFVIEGETNSAAYEYYLKVYNEYGSSKIAFMEPKKVPILLGFDANGGSGEQTKGKEAYKGYDYTVPECTFTAPEGSVFDHWTNNMGFGTYYPGDVITMSSNSESFILKAFWKTNNNGKTGDCDWSYNEDTKTLTISGSGKMADYEHENGKVITPWADYSKDIKNIAIEEGVTQIGKYAFLGLECARIETPKTTEMIREEAFSYCSNVEKIVVNGKDCVIEASAFANCDNKEISEIILNGVKSVGEEAFYECDSIKLNLGNIQSIGYGAFSLNETIAEVVIPESCTYIGDCAFSACDKLKKITVLNKDAEIVKEIGTLYTDATIYGYTGSTAQAYAQEFGRSFVELEVAETTAPAETTEPQETTSPADKPTDPSAKTQTINYLPDKTVLDKSDKIQITVQDIEGKITTCDMTATSLIIDDVPVYTAEIPDTELYIVQFQYFSGETRVGQVNVSGPQVAAAKGKIITSLGKVYGESEQPSTEPQATQAAQKAKEANPIKVSVKAKTVKLKKLKKKNQTVKAITVKNAQGKVTYKITSATKKIKKLVKISSKGVITVKKWKKAKKGTYKIKVKITAKGNTKYSAKTVSKMVKFNVK